MLSAVFKIEQNFYFPSELSIFLRTIILKILTVNFISIGVIF